MFTSVVWVLATPSYQLQVNQNNSLFRGLTEQDRCRVSPCSRIPILDAYSRAHAISNETVRR